MKYTIPNPCMRTAWGALSGDMRKRYCEHCDTPVYALDQFSEGQLIQIREAAGGKLCGMLTAESAPEPRSRRAVIAGALLTAIAPLFGQDGRVRIRVVDPSGAVVPNAEVSLLGVDGTSVQSKTSDAVGEALWTGLPVGESRFKVEAVGFQTLLIAARVNDAEEHAIAAPIRVGAIGEVLTVNAEAPVLVTTVGSIRSKLSFWQWIKYQLRRAFRR